MLATPIPYSPHNISAAEARKRFRVVISSSDCEAGSTATDFRLTLPKMMGLPSSNECVVSVVRCMVDVELAPSTIAANGLVNQQGGYVGGGTPGITVHSSLNPQNSWDSSTRGPTSAICYLAGSTGALEYITYRYAGSPVALEDMSSIAGDRLLSGINGPLSAVNGINANPRLGMYVEIQHQIAGNLLAPNASPVQNGWYTIIDLGAAGAPYVLERISGDPPFPRDTRAVNNSPAVLNVSRYALGDGTSNADSTGTPFLTHSPFGNSLHFELRDTLSHRLLREADGYVSTHLVLDVQFV